MPTVSVNGVRLYYEDTGSGEQTIVFSHGLLWSTRLFDAQVAFLKGQYRCVTYDLRGQGQSNAPASAAADIETLYGDAIALLDALDIRCCHFAGLSMGGFVGLRIALRRPERLRSLILLASSADAEARDKVPLFWIFGQVARLGGLRLAAPFALPFMFGPTFRHDPHRAAERRLWYRRLLANRRDIYRALNGSIRRDAVLDQIRQLTVPTLVAVGEEDAVTTPAHALRLHAAIPGSSLVRIPSAGHTLTVEAPDAVNDALRAFLERFGT